MNLAVMYRLASMISLRSAPRGRDRLQNRPLFVTQKRVEPFDTTDGPNTALRVHELEELSTGRDDAAVRDHQFVAAQNGHQFAEEVEEQVDRIDREHDRLSHPVRRRRLAQEGAGPVEHRRNRLISSGVVFGFRMNHEVDVLPVGGEGKHPRHPGNRVDQHQRARDVTQQAVGVGQESVDFGVGLQRSGRRRRCSRRRRLPRGSRSDEPPLLVHRLREPHGPA